MPKFLDGIGVLIEKIVDYIPGRREAKLSEIARLKRENDEITHDMLACNTDRAAEQQRNLDRIKLLEEELSRLK